MLLVQYWNYKWYAWNCKCSKYNIGIINAPPSSMSGTLGFLGDALGVLTGAYTINSFLEFLHCSQRLTVIVIHSTSLYSVTSKSLCDLLYVTIYSFFVQCNPQIYI